MRAHRVQEQLSKHSLGWKLPPVPAAAAQHPAVPLMQLPVMQLLPLVLLLLVLLTPASMAAVHSFLSDT